MEPVLNYDFITNRKLIYTSKTTWLKPKHRSCKDYNKRHSWSDS